MMPIKNVQVQLIDTPSIDRDFSEPEFFELLKRADMLLIMLNLLTNPDRQLRQTIEALAEHQVAPLQHEGRYEPFPRVFYKPVLVLANKCDDADCHEVYDVFQQLLEEEWPMLPISVKENTNIERLKQHIFDELQIVRVYSKAPGKEPDLNSPFVVQKGCTVEEFAGKVHKDFISQLKTARVWGSTSFEGQMVQRDYLLQDEDIVELKT
jgi:ribosome-interacting GTPase 1